MVQYRYNWSPRGEEREIESEKVFEESVTNFLPTFDEKYQPKDSRKLTNLKNRYKQNNKNLVNGKVCC